MCRLMGYVSDEKTTFENIVGSNFKEFVSLSFVHCDGWGIASINHAERVATLDRAPETAVTSENFKKALAKSSADGSLLHLRWATKGLPVSQDNTHPFVYEDFSFIHNGAIFPPAAMDSFIAPIYKRFIIGDTDSERYFYYLLSAISEHGLVDGVKIAVNRIRESMDYSSINAMIMNEDFFVVICEHHPERHPDWAPADYYELKYKKDQNAVLVASTGWEQNGWKPLPNHQILLVDRASLEVSVIPL